MKSLRMSVQCQAQVASSAFQEERRSRQIKIEQKQHANADLVNHPPYNPNPRELADITQCALLLISCVKRLLSNIGRK
eukprot:5027169-Amphidinium_carterae.2